MGVKVILRDEKGNVIMAMSKTENRMGEVDDIEASIKSSLQLTCYNGVSNIILESDSLWVVDVLKSFGPNLARQGSLFGEIKDLLNRFNNFELQHVGRDGIAITHNLARHAQEVGDMMVWWRSTQDLVKQYVFLDAVMASS